VSPAPSLHSNAFKMYHVLSFEESEEENILVIIKKITVLNIKEGAG